MESGQWDLPIKPEGDFKMRPTLRGHGHVEQGAMNQIKLNLKNGVIKCCEDSKTVLKIEIGLTLHELSSPRGLFTN